MIVDQTVDKLDQTGGQVDRIFKIKWLGYLLRTTEMEMELYGTRLCLVVYPIALK